LLTRVMFGAMSSVPSLYRAFDVIETIWGEKGREMFAGHWWHRYGHWVMIVVTSRYGRGEMLWFTCTNKTRATIVFTVDCIYLGIRNFVCMQFMNRLMNYLRNVIGKTEI